MRDADAGQGQRADGHHREGEGDVLAQAAHVAHVLLVMHRVDHRAGAQKQQGLEEGVGEQVEHAERIGADAFRDEHVAKLRTGRIGDDALDVVLHQTDGRGEESRGRANQRHKGRGMRRVFKDRRQARDHEDAGGDHGGGVDERGNRRRAFHGVRQPGVQEELRRFTHRADEQQEGGDFERLGVEAENMDFLAFQTRNGGEDFTESQRLGELINEEDAEREAEIADAVDDKGLDRRGVGGGLLIPEADQQIGSETDALPAEEHLHQIIGGHQHQHGEGEQRQIGEEARTVRIFVHVADRIEVHEARHGVDHDEHHRRQRVDAQGPVDAHLAGGHPVAEHGDVTLVMADGHIEKHHPRQRGAGQQQRGRDDFRGAGADPAAEAASDQKAEQRKKDDCLNHRVISP